jgi:hypothetical protein
VQAFYFNSDWMTKQEYLLAVIDAMPDWEMGRGLKAMIENNQLAENTLDILVVMFDEMIDKITDIIKKHRIIEKINAYKTLKAQKAQQAQQDAQDIERLNGMLDNF